MSTIGVINIGFSVATSSFMKGVEDAGKSVKGFASSAASAAAGGIGSLKESLSGATDHVFDLQGAVAGLAGLLTAGAVVGGLQSMASEQMANIDATAKLADRIGTTTESLVKLRFAAGLVGAETELLDEQLSMLGGNLALIAEEGSGPQADLLKRLGLDPATLAAGDPSEAFRAITAAISGLGTPAEKAAAAVTLLGDEGAKLTGLLGGGVEALDAAGAEAEKMGLTFSRVDAAKVEAANRALGGIGASLTAVGQQLAIQLSPFIKSASDKSVRTK